mgnify:CR=1 FL=1
MLRSRALLVLFVLLFSSIAPAAFQVGQQVTSDLGPTSADHGAAGRVLSCQMVNISTLPPTVTMSNQTCMSINLGELTPGTLVAFDIDIYPAPIDLLVFRGGSLPAYLNEQSYRIPGFWEQNTSLESLSGNGTQWHWQVPSDTSQTIWYVVLDHMAHAGDNGNGAQGGADTDVTLSITFPSAPYWTMHDSLQSLAPDSKRQLLGPETLTLDEGTEVSISALPLRGNPDVFIMTEQQRNNYLMNAGGNFWIAGTELLSITSPVARPWMVTSEYAGKPLYMFIDNKAGPFGGGDGSTEARATVIVELSPVRAAQISASVNLANDVDVRQTIVLDVNLTPNMSEQVDLALTDWDFDGGDSDSTTGATVEVNWTTPGDRTVTAIVNGSDDFDDSTQITVSVKDLTNPTAKILGGSSVLTRDVNSDFSIISTSTDNWMIKREDWRVDGVLVQSFNQGGSTFSHSINSTGNHTIELTVTDGADRIAAASVIVHVRDGTAPIVTSITGPADATVGEAVTFSASATDAESSGLTYTWDFDKRNDADGDGYDANDVQAQGNTVSWTFTESGAIWVVVTVENDAGLNKSVDHLIEVEGVVTTQTGSNVPFAAKIGVALIIFVLLGAGGWFLLNRRRTQFEEAALAAHHAAAQEEEVAEPEPTDVEQIAMFDTRSVALTGRAGATAEIAALAGVDPGAGQMLSDDALSAFSDMTDAPVAATSVEEHDPILDDLDFLRTRGDEGEKPEAEPATTVPSVAESEPAKKSGAGAVQLPDSTTIASPPPADAQPVTVPEPAPEAQTSTPTVRTACPACNQQFAVEMPPELSEAMVACPKCEQRIKLQR